MKKYGIRGAVVAIASLAAMGGALAEANMTNVNGNVLVNSGAGYRAVQSGVALKAGDRVLVNAKSSADLKFADGCSIKAAPGIMTIGSKSPCTVKAQGGFGGSILPLALIGGAGIGIAVLGASNSGGGNNGPLSGFIVPPPGPFSP